MRIGVNARLLGKPRLEGLARYTQETTIAMAKAHPQDEFVLFFDKKPQDLSLFAELSNIDVRVLGMPTRHPIIILYWFEILVTKALVKESIDVFYSADNFMSLRSLKPTVLVVHDIAYYNFPEGLRWDYRLFYKWFMPAYIHSAKKLVTVSNFVKEEIIKVYQVSEDKITVASNALPTRPQGGKTQVPKEPYFIYVGSIHPRKNIEGIIKAYLLFKESKPAYKLFLVGRLAWKSDSVKELLHHDGIVHFPDIEDEHIMAMIQGAEALLYPSFSEGFGIPILEGFAAGVPVITSDISAMPEIAGEAAIKVDPYSSEDISKAMMEVSTNSVYRAQMIAKGKERLLAFSWEQSASTIYNLLKKSAS